MYLHLGDNETIPYEEILAIIDIEKNKAQRSLAEDYAKQGKSLMEIVPLSKAKSLVIGPQRIYLSPISSGTLAKRAEAADYLSEDED